MSIDVQDHPYTNNDVRRSIPTLENKSNKIVYASLDSQMFNNKVASGEFLASIKKMGVPLE